ncbi:P-loop containing nucleoside triphosphate hydrolase protein [Xylaria grammica]|nr:P-loop containing nucleoside triphosphate hydrolase protein [Xylaria grammica]
MLDPSAISRVLDLLVPPIRDHLRNDHQQRPYILGVSGLQGSGKSTWAKALTDLLNNTFKINTRTVSLDDFYHDHDTLRAVRDANADNPLLRTRGQPGTHDEALALEFFSSLNDASRGPTLIPVFDKSRFGGEGDRVDEGQWEAIPRAPRLEVLIFEGWCVGFQPLSDEELVAKVSTARDAATEGPDVEMKTTTLATHRLEHLKLINDNIRRYCENFMGSSHFDGLLHLTTEDLRNVYSWRLDQEDALRSAKGTGMTREEVVAFVQGYMPAYELYLDHLSGRPFFPPGSNKAHVRVTLDNTRRVVGIRQCS